MNEFLEHGRVRSSIRIQYSTRQQQQQLPYQCRAIRSGSYLVESMLSLSHSLSCSIKIYSLFKALRAENYLSAVNICIRWFLFFLVASRSNFLVVYCFWTKLWSTKFFDFSTAFYCRTWLMIICISIKLGASRRSADYHFCSRQTCCVVNVLELIGRVMTLSLGQASLSWANKSPCVWTLVWASKSPRVWSLVWASKPPCLWALVWDSNVSLIFRP